MAVLIDFEVSEISNFRKSTSEGTQNVRHEVIKANSINIPGLVIFQKRAYIEKIVLNVPQYCNFLSSAFITLYWQTLIDSGRFLANTYPLNPQVSGIQLVL